MRAKLFKEYRKRKNEYKGMFLANYDIFIQSEIAASKESGSKLTADEWRRWIKAEEADQIAQGVEHELFTEQELNWIIEELNNAGVVAE